MASSKKLETIYYNGQPDGIRSIRRHLSTMTTYEKQIGEAKEPLSKLSCIQRKRYYKFAALGKTPTEIAEEEEGVAQSSVFESIERAKAKIEKLKNK